MNESVVKRPVELGSPNLGDVLEDVLHQAKTLFQAELSLARRELGSELRGALGWLLLLIFGAMCLEAALATLGVLLVLTFGVGVAAAAVVTVLAIIGALCALVAARFLSRSKFPRTSARLSGDAKQIVESVK